MSDYTPSTEEDSSDRQFVAHVHGCKLPPDHKGACLSDTPHKFGPDGCEHCAVEREIAPTLGMRVGAKSVRGTAKPKSGHNLVGDQKPLTPHMAITS